LCPLFQNRRLCGIVRSANFSALRFWNWNLTKNPLLGLPGGGLESSLLQFAAIPQPSLLWGS